ncbi:hypothetical protein U769_24545 [Pseudomonas aeruginosa MTB-1]|nr:hypothetical protein U769_24545 [Pseudomonas aeruginosa MTB-1]
MGRPVKIFSRGCLSAEVRACLEVVFALQEEAGQVATVTDLMLLEEG